jgi:protein arginine kinase
MSLTGASPGTWYTSPGPDTDVVLSTRVRLSRNLSGFLFPVSIRQNEAERVLSLVFDVFNHIEQPALFQSFRLAQVDTQGRRILAERGIVETGISGDPWRGIVLRQDGVVSVTVNVEDHVRVAAFGAGLCLQSCRDAVGELDVEMQRKLQYSAATGFGYLTSRLASVGSGMKASALLSLAALSMNGLLDRAIQECLAQGFTVTGYYGGKNGQSLGALYTLSNASSAAGTAASQLSDVERAAARLIELERRSRAELFAKEPNLVEDAVFRALAVAKYARYIALDEAFSLIQRIKLGLSLGLIAGISDADLTALLYRVQTAHCLFVLAGGEIALDGDVKTEQMKVERFRAMIIQEVLKKADIHERR